MKINYIFMLTLIILGLSIYGLISDIEVYSHIKELEHKIYLSEEPINHKIMLEVNTNLP